MKRIALLVYYVVTLLLVIIGFGIECYLSSPAGQLNVIIGGLCGAAITLIIIGIQEHCLPYRNRGGR